MKNIHLKYTLLSVAITSSLLFTACGHEHTFSEATCTTAKACTECNEIEGEALGHTWVDATCENPKTCSICNLTDGEALEHTWLEATTEAPKTCESCGLTDGEPLELPADVDLEKEYEEPITEEPDYESMTQDERIDAATEQLVKDIMKEYYKEQAQQNHIDTPADDDWGKVSDGTLANPTGHGQGDYSDVDHIRIN